MSNEVSLRDATCIDFTGTIEGFSQFAGFGQDIVSLIRQGEGAKVLVVVDRGFGFNDPRPHVVRDHLNLTGNNPLVGANDPCGERFPVLKDVYIRGKLQNIGEGVAVGLRTGIIPGPQESAMVSFLGGDFYCYNLVPTVIVAAHAGWKVLGVVTPDEGQPNLAAELNAICKIDANGTKEGVK